MLLSELSPLARLANAMPQARYTSKSLCTDEQFQSVCVLMKNYRRVPATCVMNVILQVHCRPDLRAKP